MKKSNLAVLLALFFLSGSAVVSEAKTKSLQEVEGDRVVALKIDKKASLPKRFLKGQAAKDYIGSFDDLKERVTKKLYTGENVIRHAKSPRFENISDGVIFNTGGGKIAYVLRRDGAFTVIIDYPSGRKLSEVDEELFDKFANTINDDCPAPYVFFDKEGNEAAIAYLPRTMRVDQMLTTDGLIAIEVSERI